MSFLSSVLEYNKEFVQDKKYENYQTDKYPKKKVLILTCMDTRLLELLPKAMNIKNGEAKIVKNAGGLIAHPFGSIMRSIIIAIYQLKVEEVYVIGHYDCGMANLNADDVIKLMREKGIPQDTFDILRKAGIDVDKWLTGFKDVKESVLSSVNSISEHPLVPGNIPVHGLVMDPKTGKLDLVKEGYKKEF